MDDLQSAYHYLKPFAWDVNLSREEIEELLSGKENMIRGVTPQNIYVKLLSTYNWYTLLKILDRQKLHEILTDDVIKRLKSKTLQEKYFYARRILFQ